MSLKEIMQRGIKRRTFLTVTGITGVAAFFGLGLDSKANARPAEVDELIHYDPRELQYEEGEWRPTGCSGCTSWCAKVAQVIDGRVVRVQGNPESKLHGDASCPRIHLTLQQLYDPDRIKQPMRRTNPNKGVDEDPQWEPITWDEAFDELAERILDLIERDEAHKFALFRGRYTALNTINYGTLPSILGSPNNISHSSICAEAEKWGPYYTEGMWGYRDHDMDNTTYAIFWGADPLSTNRKVSSALDVWPKMKENGAKIVVIDPRYSPSATKADEWLPVKSGQDGALAVAMAHVILREGLWCREFVGDFVNTGEFIPGEEVSEGAFEEKETKGLIKWWNLELKDRTPQWAEEKCGISAEDIERIAIELGESAPHAYVQMGGGAVMQIRGGANSMAVTALNGLIGAIDIEGGTFDGMGAPTDSLPSSSAFERDIVDNRVIDQRGTLQMPAIADGGIKSPGVITNNVARAINDEDPYKLEVVWSYWNNWNYSAPGTHRWNEALKKIDFLVHSGTHENEMCRFADLLLPSTNHMFEQYSFLSQKARRYTHLWLGSRVIEPIFDCKDPETEMVYLLAEKLEEKGFSNVMDWIRRFRDPVTGFRVQDERHFAEVATKIMLRPIWNEHFNSWYEFKEIGVYNSEKYPEKKRWGGNFNTESGKYEFYPERMKKYFEEFAEEKGISVEEFIEACNYQVPEPLEKIYLPHYQPPIIPGEDNEEEYPLTFIDSKSRLNREGRAPNCYWVYELNDVNPGMKPEEDSALINPQDAEELGISDGEDIRIVSPSGECTCTARVFPGVRPGEVVKAFGQGHWAHGRVAAGVNSPDEYDINNPRGGNNNDVIPAVYEKFSGSTVFYASTNVRIERV